MDRKIPTPKSLLPLALVASCLLFSGDGHADSRPIPLDRLGEKEAIRLIENARPTDVFLLRGRRVTARSLQEQHENARRRAESQARRAEEARRTFRSEDLDIARMRGFLAERARAEQAKARFDELAASLQRSLPPDSPEIRLLSEEAAKIAAAWISATPEERRTLEERSRVVVEQLRRLGVNLGR